MKVIPINSVKKKGRPRKSLSAVPSEKMRTKFWYRRTKKAVLENPNFFGPQHHRMEKVLSDINKEHNFSATQCLSWNYGNSSPSKSTLSKFSSIGIDYQDIFESDIYKLSNSPFKSEALFFSAIDTFKFARNFQDGIVGRIMEILFQLNQDWSPCNGYLSFYYEQAATTARSNHSDLEENNSCWYSWSKSGLYPGPQAKEECLDLYDHYTPSSLLPWLLSISPIYLIHKGEFERLARDIFTTVICLTALRLCMPTQSRTRSSILTSRRFTAALQLFLNPENVIDQVEEILDSNITWPYENSSLFGGVMHETLVAVKQSSDEWLNQNGITTDEIAFALDGF